MGVQQEGGSGEGTAPVQEVSTTAQPVMRMRVHGSHSKDAGYLTQQCRLPKEQMFETNMHF